MNTAAVMIAADCAGAAMLPAGGISVAQRMISSFQKAGVDTIALVTGSKDKLLEKQLTQSGVLFLHNNRPEDRTASVKLGLDYMSGSCEKLFVLTADRPLLSPNTLRELLFSMEFAAVPRYRGRTGAPLLLSARAAESLRLSANLEVMLSKLSVEHIEVEDEGVLLTAEQCMHMDEAFAKHDRQLTRPVFDLSLNRGREILDTKLIGLLSLVQQTQSVREACLMMHISYSTAWNMLNSAEDGLGYALIERNKGGASGSGSSLTAEGSALVNAYIGFESGLREQAGKLYREYFENLF